MSPFDLGLNGGPICIGSLTLDSAAFVPIVKDFDPSVEKLAFTLASEDDNTVFLHDLLDGRGVQVEAGGRVLVTLMGCVAADIPEGCLTFNIAA